MKWVWLTWGAGSEEGARFPASMLSSGVWAGDIPIEKAHAMKEVGSGGKTVREELERIGYLGEMEVNWQKMPLAAHFELHIGMALFQISFAHEHHRESFGVRRRGVWLMMSCFPRRTRSNPRILIQENRYRRR